jgi:small subunit ribosomal protein S9
MPEASKIEKYYFGTGRRKSAVARVRIFEGNKDCLINSKKAELSDEMVLPFEIVGKKGSFGVSAIVNGGGSKGQEEAIRHGITRALVKFNPEFRTSLKKAGFLSRDPREVERKKPGLKGARRAPQWSKR